MDLSNEESIKECLTKTINAFGELNVVVNNAGFGQIGFLEETTDKDVRSSFEINVFGSLNVIRNSLPFLRKEKGAHIFNISSISGFIAFGGSGIYSATKFALTGLTEALAQEVKPFGLHVTCILPGYFRTNFLSPDSIKYESNPTDTYKEAREKQVAFIAERNHQQVGDPDKLADVLISLSKEENPPVHLFVGKDAYEVALSKVEVLKKEIVQWEKLATSTDY